MGQQPMAMNNDLAHHLIWPVLLEHSHTCVLSMAAFKGQWQS